MTTADDFKGAGELLRVLTGNDVQRKVEIARALAFKMPREEYAALREALARSGDVARHS